MNSLDYDVTVIRGLRNSTDFNYEQNQYRYIQELKPDIKIDERNRISENG